MTQLVDCTDFHLSRMFMLHVVQPLHIHGSNSTASTCCAFVVQDGEWTFSTHEGLYSQQATSRLHRK